MTERALVTGGAGFIGSYIVDALIDAGWTVTVLDSLEAQVHGACADRPAYLHRAAEFVRGDARDAALVDRLLQRTDVVFYEAALVGVAVVAVGFEDGADFGWGLDLGGGGLAGNGRTNALKQRDDDNRGNDEPAKCFHQRVDLPGIGCRFRARSAGLDRDWRTMVTFRTR